MANQQEDVQRFARNVHSQYGEDGILQEVLTRLGMEKGVCVEFGAWDGRHLSNCRNLVDSGWSGCFIEGSRSRFEDLKAGLAGTDIVPVHRWVRPSGEDSLDSILRGIGVAQVDVLSIDIDGDDLAVWEGVSSVRPAIVVIEYNPTIPADVAYVNPPGRNIGNSALAIVASGRERRYKLVASTFTNLILVDSDRPQSDKLAEIPVVGLTERHSLPRLFFGYDGSLVPSLPVAGDSMPEIFQVPWSGTVYCQPIPKPLRGYAPGRRIVILRKAIALISVALRRPLSSLKLIVRLRQRGR